jgi:hypothetical protein
LLFQTGSGPTTAVTIDGSQNVGLGVTPKSTLTSTTRSLQLPYSLGLTSFTGSLDTYLHSNLYPSSLASGWANYATGGGNLFRMNGGTFYWYQAASGTADANSSLTQAMTLDASGNLLVGTTSNIVNGNARVQVVGVAGIRAQGTASGETSVGAFATSTGATYYYIGYDMTAGAIKYQVLFNGNVQNTNNSYGAISDVKLKENIVDATPKLNKLNKVRIVNYNLIGDENKQIGVIAQELETVFPSMVEEIPDYESVTTIDEQGNETTEQVLTGTTTKSVKYSVFVPMLIKAIQEQQALITQLQADVAALKG